MTRRLGIFDVDVDNALIQLTNTTNKPLPEIQKRQPTLVAKQHNDLKKIEIDLAMKVVSRQMALNSLRERTIKEYNYTFNRFTTLTNLTYVHEITVESIYEFLSKLGNIAPASKLNRLKTIQAVLNRFYENAWIQTKFWKNIKIKVDKKVKKPTSEEELSILLSLLDTSTFVGFRDTVAVLLIYKTGIRIRTLGLLEEKHIDFKTNTLILSGDIQKNHNSLKLPLPDDIAELLKQLIKQNNTIRKHYHEKNQYIFINNRGKTVETINSTANLIAKQLGKYTKKFGLKNINAHSIRRLYAHNLLKSGASVALISKALGHTDLAVTSRYLNLTENEVVDNLREFM
ncbi:tyrosine-type recombinase/integrase [Rummeliibacillus stabekisii]|uniref:tyrosine-type recombinase/integrase n=1 Tax=Rummeliibacillus stabekisii TaxID=241244 RepID=UPI003710C258